MAKYRLDTMLTGETLDRLIELAKKEKRSKSAMAAYLIEEGLGAKVRETEAFRAGLNYPTNEKLPHVKKQMTDSHDS